MTHPSQAGTLGSIWSLCISSKTDLQDATQAQQYGFSMWTLESELQFLLQRKVRSMV